MTIKNKKKQSFLFVTVFFCLVIPSLALRKYSPELLSTFSPDSDLFEKNAFVISEKIKKEGWSSWKLAPEMQTPVGIASIIVFVFKDISVPIVVMNATLLALAAFLTANMVLRLGYGWVGYWAACTPFCLPSSVLTTSVLHKDPFVILGVVCILFGLIKCEIKNNNLKNYRPILIGFILVGTGAAFVWLMRNYAVLLLCFGTLGYAAAQVITSIGKNLIIKKYSNIKISLINGIAAFFASSIILLPLLLPPIHKIKEVGLVERSKEPFKKINFKSGESFGNLINSYIQILESTRKNYIANYPDAKTVIDKTQKFENLHNIMAYLPRAAKIGFFAPFPEAWLDEKRSAKVNILVALEMMIIYSGLAGFFILMIRKPEKTLPFLVFSLIIILIYVISIPNLGTLYRMRLPYLWPIAGLGFANMIKEIKKITAKKNVKTLLVN